MTINAIKQAAVSLAHLADKVPMIAANIHEAVEIGEKSKQTVHKTYLAFLGGIGKERMDGIPRPGSTKPQVPQANDLWDKYDDADETTGNKKDGSYVNDFADATDEGIRINTAIRNFTQTSDLSDPDKKERVGKMTSQKTTLRSVIRRTFMLHYRIRDVKEEFPHVGVSFKMTGDGKSYDFDTIKPVCLTDKAPNDNPDAPRSYKYLSVGEFLALKLEKAKVNRDSMGHWKALTASATKGKKGTGKTGAAPGTSKAPRVTSVEQFVDYASEGAAFLDDGTGTVKGVAQILAVLAKMPAGDDRKHFVRTMYTNAMAWDLVYRAVQDEGERIMLEQNAINAGLKAPAKAA